MYQRQTHRLCVGYTELSVYAQLPLVRKKRKHYASNVAITRVTTCLRKLNQPVTIGPWRTGTKSGRA